MTISLTVVSAGHCSDQRLGDSEKQSDGSVDVYFGRKAQWGKGWFTILHLYGAFEPWFDKTWRPGEIELVK